ncbi:MAG: AAA family ATPase [Eubacteriales bacterium]|nr:AAA family ATPase [Eubacteriales bacterium]
MGIYLNPGNQMFQESLDSEIYVDKSTLITYTNRVLSTRQKYVCISRPRRFGKSMAAQMLAAYYDRSCDSAGQFDGLAVTSDPSYERHRNRYNVIQLNMQNFLSQGKDVDGMIRRIEIRLCYELSVENPEVVFLDASDFFMCMEDVYTQTKIPFIIIIDEWDCIFRIHQEDDEAQKKYLDYLRNLLKDQPYVALAYMTGILPVKKYGQHSALNMFTEVSMTNPRELARETGFTKEEVMALCERYDMPYEEEKHWYDGYNLRGISVYNPRSVVMSMTGHDFDNYWTQTETFEALRVYIEMDFDGLREKVIRMIAGERIPINTEKFQNDMRSLSTADDVLTLLIHLGYLTYDFETNEVWIPNNEVQKEFINCIEDRGWEIVMKEIRASEGLTKSLLRGEEDAVAAAVEAAHDRFSSIFAYNDENTLASILVLAFYAARKGHVLQREYASGKGYADLVLIPRPGKGGPAIVLELKMDEAVSTAIDQIRERNYPQLLLEYSGEILLCGISYNRKTKAHACRIERLEKTSPAPGGTGLSV